MQSICMNTAIYSLTYRVMFTIKRLYLLPTENEIILFLYKLIIYIKLNISKLVFQE